MGNKDVRVEDRTGEVHAVSLRGACSCGQPSCDHRTRVDRADHPDRGAVFEAKSGLHKELRRGDAARAKGYAQTIEAGRPGAVRLYLRRIVTEETRSLALLDRVESASDQRWPELVDAFCGVVKDWELPWTVNFWTPTWIQALASMGAWPPPLPSDAEDVLLRVV